MDWNNINTDRDTSGLGPIEYDQSKVPALIRKHADNVRTKTYGQEVREAQARNAELAGLIASEADQKATNADALSKDTQNRFKDQIEGTTNNDEVIDARRPVYAENTFATLNERLEYSFKRKPTHALNIQAMIDDGELQIGDVVMTLGYNEIFDGGGCIYKIIEETEIADGYSIIGLANGFKAKMIVNGRVNVKAFGASGNGIIDDTEAIQYAIDNFKDVYIPKGVYNINTIYTRDDTTIAGAGDSTILQNIGEDSSIKIGNYLDGMNTRIKSLRLTGDILKQNQHGIELTGANAAYVLIEDVKMERVGGHGIYGGHLGHVNNVEIKGSYIRYSGGDGIHLNYKKGQINAIWIHHNDISENENGISFSGNNVTVENNTVQANRQYAFKVGTENKYLLTDGYLDEATYGSSIRKNYTELNGTELTSNVAVIGIFHGYKVGNTFNQKVIRNLEIGNNMFGESGHKYISIIRARDLFNSDTSSRTLVLFTENNFGHIPILDLSKPEDISINSVIDEALAELITPTTAALLPYWVEVRGNAKRNLLNWKALSNNFVDIGTTKKFIVPEYFTEVVLRCDIGDLVFNRTRSAGSSQQVKVLVYNEFGNSIKVGCTFNSTYEFTVQHFGGGNGIAGVMYR